MADLPFAKKLIQAWRTGKTDSESSSGAITKDTDHELMGSDAESHQVLPQANVSSQPQSIQESFIASLQSGPIRVNEPGKKPDMPEKPLTRAERRGPRRFLFVKLKVRGTDLAGKRFEEQTLSEVVSISGGCIFCSHDLSVGSIIAIANPNESFMEYAIVKNVRPSEGGRKRVGFQFTGVVTNWVLS